MPKASRAYLDHAATSPLRPEALEAIIQVLGEPGNPSSTHQEGRSARRTLENARSQLAKVIGVEPSRIIFTSGATEGNTAVMGQAENCLISAIEHPSVYQQPNVTTFAVDSQGRADLDDLSAKLTATQAGLVSLMLVNNETGVVQPVKDAARIARAQGALFHIDAVQALGRIDLTELDADYITVCAHKIGGPKGIGAIAVPQGRTWTPLITGGGQEQRRRSGTENVSFAAGFAAALGAMSPAECSYIQALRTTMEAELIRQLPGARVLGADAKRADHITAVALPDISAATALMKFDLEGIAISAGSACSSGKVASSHVLSAMGVEPDLASRTIRISLGWNSTMTEVERFLDVANRV